MASIRVLLADDHTLFRHGIRTLLSGAADIQVVGETATTADAVQLAAEVRPDVVLLDIGMPGISSFEAAQQMKKHRPEMKILFLTMYDDDDYLVRAMEGGAAGYVLKDSPASDLITAVREVCRGGTHLSPRMLKQLMNDFQGHKRGDQPRSRLSRITPRECEVLKMLAEGDAIKEIACKFNLSVRTIEVHKRNLMRKLALHNRAQLVQYAIQHKIIKIDMMDSRPVPLEE